MVIKSSGALPLQRLKPHGEVCLSEFFGRNLEIIFQSDALSEYVTKHVFSLSAVRHPVIVCFLTFPNLHAGAYFNRRNVFKSYLPYDSSQINVARYLSLRHWRSATPSSIRSAVVDLKKISVASWMVWLYNSQMLMIIRAVFAALSAVRESFPKVKVITGMDSIRTFYRASRWMIEFHSGNTPFCRMQSVRSSIR